jgi:hypothetical protein
MTPRIVMIQWEDASVEDCGPWVVQEDAKPMPVKLFHQVGFLLEDTPECVVMTCAMEEPGKGLMASRERIPRGMVRSIVDLVPAAKPARGAKRKPV